MLNDVIYKIKNNKDYLIGLLGVIIVSLATMSIFYNKSIVNYDGWYNLYAQDIISGKIPYKDFHFLMPPVFLYVWTALQKIFGNYVIVSHCASMICKTILLSVIYHIFTRFYNVKISFIATIITLSVMITLIFDNCTFSYNEFVTLLVAILVVFCISFVEKFYQGSIRFKYVILIAFFNTLLFFTKQTHGIIVPFASIIILMSILAKKVTGKDFFKITLVYVLTSILTTGLVFLPIFKNFSPVNYIENVYVAASAKGSIGKIFHVPLSIVARYDYLWPLLVFGIIAFLIYIIKKYGIWEFSAGDNKTRSEWLPDNLISTFIFLITIGVSYALVLFFSKVYMLSGIVNNVYHISNQLCCIGEFIVLFIAVFYFVTVIIKKNDLLSAKKLILFGIFFASAFAATLSTAEPYVTYYILGLSIAALLNYRFKYSKFLNITVFVMAIIALGGALSSKISCPVLFHGWQGLNIVTERKISKLNYLKGMKLSKIEVDMYEDIYDVLNKYLSAQDRIFAFINNQVFYQLLDREPFYDDHYSLYWDVCSESCASDIYGKFNTNILSKLPPAIIYFEYPDGSIVLHEFLFRNGNKDNAQRKIDIQIRNYIKNDYYKVVKTYNYKKYYEDNSLLKNDFKKLDTYNEYYMQIINNYDYENFENVDAWQKFVEIEKKQKFLNKQFKNKLNDLNSKFIIESGYELKILIRKDLYLKGK